MTQLGKEEASGGARIPTAASTCTAAAAATPATAAAVVTPATVATSAATRTSSTTAATSTSNAATASTAAAATVAGSSTTATPTAALLPSASSGRQTALQTFTLKSCTSSTQQKTPLPAVLTSALHKEEQHSNSVDWKFTESSKVYFSTTTPQVKDRKAKELALLQSHTQCTL